MKNAGMCLGTVSENGVEVRSMIPMRESTKQLKRLSISLIRLLKPILANFE